MKRTLPLTTGLALCLASFAANARSAEIICVSQPAGYTFCRADTSRGVTLVAQTSPFACNKGNTWDFDKGGIWVANGCAARFRLGPETETDDVSAKAQASGGEALARDLASEGRAARKRSAPAEPAAANQAPPSAAKRAAPPKGLGEPSMLVCESKQYKPKRCPVPVRAYVRLNRKLGNADCKFNSSWGYDYGEIWVANGCRAEFAVY